MWQLQEQSLLLWDRDEHGNQCKQQVCVNATGQRFLSQRCPSQEAMGRQLEFAQVGDGVAVKSNTVPRRL